jgi:transposase
MSARPAKRRRQQKEQESGEGIQRRAEELQRHNERLERELEKLRDQLAEAQKKISDLERQLALRKQNSTNSSKPPSSDGLAGDARKRGRRGQSKRKPGGQPGHAGRTRELAPADRVNRFVDLYPDECRACGQELPASGKGVIESGEPRRHQVIEIPEIQPEITEYRLHSVICVDPDCEHATTASLPEEIENSFGSRLVAWIAYMTVVCRMPRRMVQYFLEEALGIGISVGSTQKAWEEASDAVEAPCEELNGDLKNQAVLNGDETGHRTNGEKRWLWVLVAKMYVVFKIATTRKAEVLVALLGRVFAGILCSDRCPSYAKYHNGRLQYCWAHFKRNILGALELAKTTEAERFCRDALALHARLFRLWHRYRGNGSDARAKITREELIVKMIPIEKKFFTLAERHVDSPDRDVRKLARALFLNFERFFTFVDHEQVEPTNNIAERALRHAVIWRKIMMGCRSEAGEVAVARLLTVAQTCKMQKRPTLAYLTNAIQRHRYGQIAPSLLPR